MLSSNYEQVAVTSPKRPVTAGILLETGSKNLPQGVTEGA